MSQAELKKIVTDCYDAINKKDWAVVDSIMDENVELHFVVFDQKAKGRKEVMNVLKDWVRAFPDMEMKIADSLITEEGAAVELNVKGTHQETLKMPGGELPATNKAVTIRGCEILRFSNQKITSVHTYIDSLSLMQQLGATEKLAA